MSASTAGSSMPSEPSSCPMCARRAEASKTALAIRRLAPGLLAPLRYQLVGQSVGSADQLAGDLAGLPERDLGADQVKLARPPAIRYCHSPLPTSPLPSLNPSLRTARGRSAS